MTQTDAPPLSASYRSLLRISGVKPLLVTALLSRTALMMSTVAFVLFTLQRFHSPAVAGLTVFLLVFPGLAMSPINGALLDRFGRIRMMTVDLGVTATGVLVIAVLAWTGALTVVELLVIVTLASLTGSLSSGGTRSLFPLVVPQQLWERANALDILCYGLAAIAGPALAGALTEWVGGPGALLGIAAAYLAAAAPLLAVRDRRVGHAASKGVLRDARDGVRYVTRSRSLRWLAITVCLVNAGWGIVTVALPLTVLALHQGAGVVGAVFAVEGIVAVPAAMFGGRLDTRGRERQIIAVCVAATAMGTLLLLAPALALLFVGLAIIGAANGPLNVALFALRQRRTAPQWFGRVFAISISLNYAGMPVGAAVAGAIATRSLAATLVLAACLPLVAVALVWNIPARETPAVELAQPDLPGRAA
jgi:MFS family permease